MSGNKIMSLRRLATLLGECKVVNFSRPVTVAPGCFHVLSLQLLHRSPPLNQVFTLSLNTSLGPTLHVPLYFHSTFSKQGGVLFGVERECSRPCPLRLSETGRSEWQRSLLPDFFPSSWWPRLPVETSSTLDFGATPVNESKVKTFVLKNPSSSVVAVEIRILSLYPAPLEALDLLTKWFNISPVSVNISTAEFSLLASSLKSADSVQQNLSGEGVLRLLLQPWESREVAVVYTPSEHKPTTTILIIRGHGAKELIRVGSKLPGPGASLRFNVPQSLLMECRDGLRNNKPLFAIKKSFKVENAGSSSRLHIVLGDPGPDPGDRSWHLVPLTLNVTLPHHMLPLCAQVMPGPSWEENFWLLTLLFVLRVLDGFDEAHYILNDFTTPSIRSNHNSNLPRDNGTVNNITPNGVNKSKGSCKSYVDSCHPSDKGKGRGSPALANSLHSGLSPPRKTPPPHPPRPRRNPKYPCTTPSTSTAQPPRSLWRRRAKTQRSCSQTRLLTPRPDPWSPAFLSEMERGSQQWLCFPWKMPAGFPDNMTVEPWTSTRPAHVHALSAELYTAYDKVEAVKRDSSEQELRGDGKSQKKKVQSAESGTAPGNKGKRSRKKSENGLSAPEHSLTTAQREKEPEWKNGNHNSAARSRNRNGCKTEAPKTGPCAESPLKLNGMLLFATDPTKFRPVTND
ncbi:hypothetical protein WMY93_011477 [Mugilogobius chulae]|uniref:Transmembrane protein 131-like N-terminal domain-containing protein n=1 Tax=Mugilogobius chulae TaxID=88201 RepID=A0AAW0P606_9GOBI